MSSNNKYYSKWAQTQTQAQARVQSPRTDLEKISRVIERELVNDKAQKIFALGNPSVLPNGQLCQNNQFACMLALAPVPHHIQNFPIIQTQQSQPHYAIIDGCVVLINL